MSAPKTFNHEMQEFDVGANFGASMKFPDATPIIERIDVWCEFDTAVGWGNLRIISGATNQRERLKKVS